MNIDGRPYSGVNTFLLAFLPYKDPRYVTFNRCRELGGSVKKGEHGHIVCYYGPGGKKAVTKSDGTTEDKPNRILLYYKVFNVEQCDGLTLKPLPAIEFNPIEKAEDIDRGYIGKPEVLHGNYDTPAYSVNLDQVYMPHRETFVDEAAYYASKFHEYGHSTRHETRLNRNREGVDHNEKYSREELVAELASAFLCAEARIDSPAILDNTAAYVQSWIRALKNDPSMITWASAKANQAANYILGTHRIKPDSESEEAVETESQEPVAV
jgi:antirestriction protein ArdC